MITYYDDATGEHTALTATELGDWASATAALLTEECGLGTGSTAAVLLPPHWQTAAVLLGAWSAGIEVSYRGWATAGLIPAGDPLDATFVHEPRIDSWLDEVPVGTHQFALTLSKATGPAAPAGEHPPTGTQAPSGMTALAGSRVPAGYRDFLTAVRPHLGAPPPAATPGPDRFATVDGTTYGAYAALAADIAAGRGIKAGDRVLVDARTQEQPLIWLLAPLVAGASIVVCADLDPATIDSRAAAERITHSFL